MKSAKVLNNKVIMITQGRICKDASDLLTSELFIEIVKRCINKLSKKYSILLNIFGKEKINEEDISLLIKTLQILTETPAHLVPTINKNSKVFLKNVNLLNDFVEYLYNYWRSYDRFVICDSEGNTLNKQPYRTFNETIEELAHLVRKVYRDIQENITGKHPYIYRQVRAGAEIAAIALPKDIPFPAKIYKKLKAIPIIRQILLYPPMVLNPPMNKRSGKFEKINQNPLVLFDLKEDEWLCYPAKVGPLLILIYFNEKFFELGFSLCNLFELASDEDLKRKPDAVYTFGIPGDVLDNAGSCPTVFYDDEKHNMLAAAVPNNDLFGYFGYLKKMVLTLHNITMMKRGIFPFHGALVEVVLEGNKKAVILIIGDTGAGKSETLEAFRMLGEAYIRDFIIIADDMGSLEINAQNEIIGFGTEIGAFLRLDDLQPGYAFGTLDRAIFMSPTKINARVVIPVTTYETVMKGHKVDFILYANNYDDIDEDHPIIERFTTPYDALKIFREGTVMSKGTTTSSGLVHFYFANIFGPPQYKALHEEIAGKYFDVFFKKGVFVGQIRTRLGIAGWEMKGPEEAAKELLQIIANK